MRRATIIAILSCSVLATGPVYAQPSPIELDLSPKVTLHLENTTIAKVVQAVTSQGKVMVGYDSNIDLTSPIIRVEFEKAAPEIVLRTLAQGTELRMLKTGDKTFMLLKKSSAEKIKPYTILLRLDNTLVQEIQVEAQDTFSVGTKADKTRWLITGANSLDATGMGVDLRIERVQTEADGYSKVQTFQTNFHALIDPKKLWSSSTKFHAQIYNKEITLSTPTAQLPLVIAVRKTMPPD